MGLDKGPDPKLEKELEEYFVANVTSEAERTLHETLKKKAEDGYLDGIKCEDCPEPYTGTYDLRLIYEKPNREYDGIQCDKCEKCFKFATGFFHCDNCDYDECGECILRRKLRKPKFPKLAGTNTRETNAIYEDSTAHPTIRLVSGGIRLNE